MPKASNSPPTTTKVVHPNAAQKPMEKMPATANETPASASNASTGTSNSTPFSGRLSLVGDEEASVALVVVCSAGWDGVGECMAGIVFF